MGIFRSRWVGASAAPLLVASLLIAGCGGKRAANANTPTPAAAARTLPLTAVLPLGPRDTLPADTTAVLAAGEPRHIVLRTAPPENLTYADLFFDALAFQAAPGAPVRITLRPAPGAYGLVVESDTPFRNGGEITFKYAVNFPAPPDAVARYGNALLYERALAIGRTGADGTITLLPSTHPAADNVQAPLAEPGTYLVAAPR